jgi:hypothetical protein
MPYAYAPPVDTPLSLHAPRMPIPYDAPLYTVYIYLLKFVRLDLGVGSML